MTGAAPDFCRLNLRDDDATEGAVDRIGFSDRMGPAAKPAGCCVVRNGDLGGSWMPEPVLDLVKLVWRRYMGLCACNTLTSLMEGMYSPSEPDKGSSL